MRTCGILMPVSSLPGPYGIGSLGAAAYQFVDFLKESSQSYWQILPIGPTGYGDSPYQSFSAFSGNPYFIDLDTLKEQNLLTEQECDTARYPEGENIDYRWLFDTRFSLLRKAVGRMNRQDEDFKYFCADNVAWLEDYALFMALKSENLHVAWQDWPDELRLRDETALKQARLRLGEDIHFWQAVQYLFFKQWFALKSYANQNGIQIIGDIPIYVSPDSSEIWANSQLFQVNQDKRQTLMAGCPPDAFSADGQLWGNPLYNWEYHAKTDFAWWVERLRTSQHIYDITRIDHFRGFAGYFAIPAEDKTAVNGHW
ncbi:MAG: 4-alpha-glucanotransferase, partial [Oscillospiraceae bacterium]|nr:4-alpha-glucanotransferase [Oscillospiraceae bacterium]